MAADKIKSLYDTFVAEGYDMEPEDTFRANMAKPDKRRAAYDQLVEEGYEMEPYDEYERNLGFVKQEQPAPQAQPQAQTQPQAQAQPKREQREQQEQDLPDKGGSLAVASLMGDPVTEQAKPQQQSQPQPKPQAQPQQPSLSGQERLRKAQRDYQVAKAQYDIAMAKKAQREQGKENAELYKQQQEQLAAANKAGREAADEQTKQGIIWDTPQPGTLTWVEYEQPGKPQGVTAMSGAQAEAASSETQPGVYYRKDAAARKESPDPFVARTRVMDDPEDIYKVIGLVDRTGASMDPISLPEVTVTGASKALIGERADQLRRLDPENTAAMSDETLRKTASMQLSQERQEVQRRLDRYAEDYPMTWRDMDEEARDIKRMELEGEVSLERSAKICEQLLAANRREQQARRAELEQQVRAQMDPAHLAEPDVQIDINKRVDIAAGYDEEMRALRQEEYNLNDFGERWEAAKADKQGSVLGNFARGVGRGIAEIAKNPLGLVEGARDTAQMMRARRKINEGKELTKAEQAAVESHFVKSEGKAKTETEKSSATKAGEFTAALAEIAVEFGLNPASGFVRRTMQQIAKEVGLKEIRGVLRNTPGLLFRLGASSTKVSTMQLAGNLARMTGAVFGEGASATFTTQLAKNITESVDRALATPVKDESGRLRTFEGDSGAAAKTFLTSAGTNAAFMVPVSIAERAFSGIQKYTRYLDQRGLGVPFGNPVDALAKMKSGEVMGVLSADLVGRTEGDATWEDVFDAEANKDLIIGLLASEFATGALKFAKGQAQGMADKYSRKKELARAQKRVLDTSAAVQELTSSMKLGEQMQLKNVLDKIAGTNMLEEQEVVECISETLGMSFDPQTRAAILDYLRAFNYLLGAQKGYETWRETIKKSELTEDEWVSTEEEPEESPEESGEPLTTGSSEPATTPEETERREYEEMEAARAEVETEDANQQEELEPITVLKVSTDTGERILDKVSGYIAYDDNGNVIRDQSDATIAVRDPKTGEVMMIDAGDIIETGVRFGKAAETPGEPAEPAPPAENTEAPNNEAQPNMQEAQPNQSAGPEGMAKLTAEDGTEQEIYFTGFVDPEKGREYVVDGDFDNPRYLTDEQFAAEVKDFKPLRESQQEQEQAEQMTDVTEKNREQQTPAATGQTPKEEPQVTEQTSEPVEQTPTGQPAAPAVELPIAGQPTTETPVMETPTADVQPANETPTTEATATAPPPMKFDARKKPLYTQVPHETTINHIFGDPDVPKHQGDKFVDNMIAKAQKAVDDIKGKEPEMGDDLDEWKAKYTRWKELSAQAEHDLQYWQTVKDMTAEHKEEAPVEGAAPAEPTEPTETTKPTEPTETETPASNVETAPKEETPVGTEAASPEPTAQPATTAETEQPKKVSYMDQIPKNEKGQPDWMKAEPKLAFDAMTERKLEEMEQTGEGKGMRELWRKEIAINKALDEVNEMVEHKKRALDNRKRAKPRKPKLPKDATDEDLMEAKVAAQKEYDESVAKAQAEYDKWNNIKALGEIMQMRNSHAKSAELDAESEKRRQEIIKMQQQEERKRKLQEAEQEKRLEESRKESEERERIRKTYGVDEPEGYSEWKEKLGISDEEEEDLWKSAPEDDYEERLHDLYVPMSAEEEVYIRLMNSKVDVDSYLHELGSNHKEELRHVPVHARAKKENGGMTLTMIAHKLYEDSRIEGSAPHSETFLHNMDDGEILGMILDTILGGAWPTKAQHLQNRKDMLAIYRKQKREYEIPEDALLDEYCQGKFGMDYESTMAMEEALREQHVEMSKDFDESEYNAILAQDYDRRVAEGAFGEPENEQQQLKEIENGKQGSEQPADGSEVPGGEDGAGGEVLHGPQAPVSEGSKNGVQGESSRKTAGSRNGDGKDGNVPEGAPAAEVEPKKEAAPAAPQAAKTNNSDTIPSDKQLSGEGYTIASKPYTNKHGKTLDTYLVTFDRDFSKEEQSALRAKAKELKGWKDRESGGWMLRSKEDAEAFAKDVMGKSEDEIADEAPLSVKGDILPGDHVYLKDGTDGHIYIRNHSEDGKVLSYVLADGRTVSPDDLATAGITKPKKRNKWIKEEDAAEFERLMDDMRRELAGGDVVQEPGAEYGAIKPKSEPMSAELCRKGLAVTYIMMKGGLRKFSDYCEAMVDELGDAIRPHLKSLYAATQNMEEVIAAGWDEEMDDRKVVKAFDVYNFDKQGPVDVIGMAQHIVDENKSMTDTEKEIKNLKHKRNEQRRKEADKTSAGTNAVAGKAETVAGKVEDQLKDATDEQTLNGLAAQIDEQLDEVNKQLALLGFYKADQDEKDFNEVLGYMRNAERKAAQDAHKLATQLAKDLGIDVNPKGRVKKGKSKNFESDLVQSNVAPAGGDVSIRLPLKDGHELYINISLDPTESDLSRFPYHQSDDLEVTGIMYRVENPSGKGSDRYVTSNAHADTKTTYSDLLADIKRTVRDYLPEAKAVENTPTQPQPEESLAPMAKRKSQPSKPNERAVKPEQTLGGLFDDLFAEQEENGNFAETTTKTKKNEKADVRPGTGEAGGEGGHEPRQNEPLGESKRNEAQGADGRGMAGRDRKHPVSDTERGSSVSSTREGEQRLEPSEHKNTRNNHAERGVDYAPKGEKARIDANIAAIELAHKLIEEGRIATKREMEVLRRYSGWGGLGSAFNEKDGWRENPINKHLRELLSQEEYDAVEMSRNSAYYTPAPIIDVMWDIARALGFNGGSVLEGSAGIGNIIGLMPADMSERSNIHAVEIDKTTGDILKLLYPDAKVEVQGFEQTYVGNGTVDLAITNVPFVTGLHVMDESGDSDLSKKFRDIHDFCIAKNVRKLREGGIGIFITTSGTLDNSQKLRDWLVSEGRADVVGAFRMNNQTFGGTAATSDIIVIRKRVNGRPSANAIDVSTVSPLRTAKYTREYMDKQGKLVKETKDLPLLLNRYFIEHPECMGGEMRFGFEQGSTYRETSRGLWPVRDKDQKQLMQQWAQRLGEVDWSSEQHHNAIAPIHNENEVLGEGVKEGSMLLDAKGRLCVAQRGSAVPMKLNANKIKGRTKEECFKDYKAIKDALAKVLEYQTTNESDAGLKPLLDMLNKAYDVFVERYGNLNGNRNLPWLRADVDFSAIAALETFNERGVKEGDKIKKVVTYGKSDIFSRRVVDKESEPHPHNVKDGIIASIYKHGRVDMRYMAEQLGKDESEIRKEIVESGLGFEDPISAGVEVSYEYLSGNVRQKLRQAKEANTDGRYDVNIKALEAVVPMNIPAHLIEFAIGAPWVDPKLYERYIKERTDIDVTLTNAGGTWHMNVLSNTDVDKNITMGVRSELLDKLIPGHELINAALTNKSINVSRTRKKYNGTSETIVDKDAITACAAKVDEIRQDFKDWAREQMQNDTEMSQRIEDTYNEQLNNYVPKSIPDEFVPDHFGGAATIVGGKPFKLRTHQAKAVIRATTQPVMLAHEVGTGKTYTLITAAMEMRRLGTAQKPMIVVQNATVGQFVASAKALYPNAKILTLEDADRNAEGRRAFYAKIKYNDWDMIVVPQSVFEKIPDSKERQIQFIRDKIAEKLIVLEQMKAADPDGKSLIVKQAELEIQNCEEEIEAIANGQSVETKTGKKKKEDGKTIMVVVQNTEVHAKEMLDREVDDVEDFDSMGIDALLVDEAHEYKHLGFATAMRRGVKGVDPSFSKKSQGVFLKTQAVLQKTGGKNVVFATGTPISNTAAEIWTFMRYLMPADLMKDYGIYYFDDFVRSFGNIQQMMEFATNGKYKENNRFAGYVNLPELVRIWSSVADTVLTREAGGVTDKIPELEGGKAQDIFLPQTRALRSVMKYVNAQLDAFEQMSGQQKKENRHIPLTMYGIAKAAAIDARLVQSDAEDDPHSKTNEAVRQTLRTLEETKGYSGTVAIFADLIRNKESGFNLYEDIRGKLIAAGVPEEQIVVMKSGMTVKKKAEIFDKVNAGEVRVIMGSTSTLGTGVNIQERLNTVIHLDAPNRPMDYTQRNGRILRQGNLHKDLGLPVKILRFGVENSLDVTAYQRLKTKGAIADSIMNGKQLMADSMEDRTIDEEQDLFGDMTAQLSGSEYALLKNQIEKEVKKLNAKQKMWEADQTYIHNRKLALLSQNNASERQKATNQEALSKVESAKVNGITVGKHTYAGLDDMADFIKEQNKKKHERQEEVRKSYSTRPVVSDLVVSVGGFDFNIHTEIIREVKSNQGNLFSVASTKMTYSCEALGLKDIPVHQQLIKNALTDIMENVMTGKNMRERIEASERSIEQNNTELSKLAKREGVPFEFSEALAKAKEKLAETEVLMEKELASIKAKYAELDKEVDEAQGVSFSEEDNEDTVNEPAADYGGLFEWADREEARRAGKGVAGDLFEWADNEDRNRELEKAAKPETPKKPKSQPVPLRQKAELKPDESYIDFAERISEQARKEMDETQVQETRQLLEQLESELDEGGLNEVGVARQTKELERLYDDLEQRHGEEPADEAVADLMYDIDEAIRRRKHMDVYIEAPAKKKVKTKDGAEIEYESAGPDSYLTEQDRIDMDAERDNDIEQQVREMALDFVDNPPKDPQELTDQIDTLQSLWEELAARHGESPEDERIADIMTSIEKGINERKGLDLDLVEAPEPESPYNKGPLKPVITKPEGEGEFCLIERVFEQKQTFDFCAGERIKDASDVAYIFRSLETAGKEHMFVVMVKDGVPTAIEVSMGNTSSTIFERSSVLLALSRINPDEVYLVHNHPSGALECSVPDVQILKAAKETCGDVPVYGVIINLKTGHYATYDSTGHSEVEDVRVPENPHNLTIHTLDKQIFEPDFDPSNLFQIRSADDVAAFLNSHRMGDRSKVSFLILNRGNKVIGNIHTPFTRIEPGNKEEMARYIAERVIQFGGEGAIIYGDFKNYFDKSGSHMAALKKEVSRIADVTLLDVVNVDGNNTKSAGDYGMLHEPGSSYGNVTDEQIAAMNKRQAQMADASPEGKRNHAESMASKLNTPVRIVENAEEITDADPVMQQKKRNSKGYYDTATGEVVINLSKNRDVGDVTETMFHEIVGHKGLREFVGKERYGEFLRDIYDHCKEDIRRKIAEKAASKGWDFEKATDEHLAELAEKGFEDFDEGERSIWQKLKQKVLDAVNKLLEGIGLPKWVKLGDNELRYMLWRSRENLRAEGKGKESETRDAAKRQELGLGEGVMFRDPSDTRDIWEDGSLGLEERMTAAALRFAQASAHDKGKRDAAMRKVRDNLQSLMHDMRNRPGRTTKFATADAKVQRGVDAVAQSQRHYDQVTAKRVCDLARTLMQTGMMDEMTSGEMQRVLSAMKDATGAEDMTGSIDKIMDIMLDNQLRKETRNLKELLSLKGSKVDARGVEVQGDLDPEGAAIVRALKRGMDLSEAEVQKRIGDAVSRMGSADQALADEAALEYSGLQLALQYVQDVKMMKDAENGLRIDLRQAKSDMQGGFMSKDDYEQAVEATNDAIRRCKLDRAAGYGALVEQLGSDMRQSILKAEQWRKAEHERVREILHNANSDLEGEPAQMHRGKQTWQDKAANMMAATAFAPLATFEQMMRGLLGGKAADGEGYCVSRFVRGLNDAREKEISGYRQKQAIIDDKIAEIFEIDDPGIDSMSKLIKHCGRLPKMTVTYYDRSAREYTETELPQDHLLYIYMIDKMADGQMKLRHMGIDEDMVQEITKFLDPHLVKFADWVQSKFLVETRNEYNETHKRMFGASMAAIEDYFPIKILGDARTVKEDIDATDTIDGVTSTVTGALKKRVPNSLDVDIMNTSALHVLMDHLSEMEHWNAYAELGRDMNTLLSYGRFRNRVKNMRTVYGAGEKLWKRFKDVSRIAFGTYHQQTNSFDEGFLKLARLNTAAKVSFRINTALKQLLSMPAMLPDLTWSGIKQGLENPKECFLWAKNNLPIFEERWRSRISGDVRLKKSDQGWDDWRKNVVEIATRWGMTANAFVDAVTCSIVAKVTHDSRLAQYLKEGYARDAAEKKAMQDASMSFNLSQQSSEGMYLAPIQADKNWLSTLFTVFRNASMSYTRQVYDSGRQLGRNLNSRKRGESVRFMTKQILREWGEDPDSAAADVKDRAEGAAEHRMKRTIMRDFVRMATYGFLLPGLWSLGGHWLYMGFGNDDKEKDKVWEDILARMATAPMEGLAGGDVLSNGVSALINDSWTDHTLEKDMPIIQDITETAKKLFRDKRYAEGISDMINLVIQSGFGFNPQTVESAVIGCIDACGGDLKLSHEGLIIAARILNCPESQVKKLYFDEIGLSGEKASKLSPQQIAERYARYQVKIGRPVMPWMWKDQDAIEYRMKGKYGTLEQAKSRRYDGNPRVLAQYADFERRSKEVGKRLSEAKELVYIDYVEGAKAMAQVQKDPDFELYARFNALDSNLDRLSAMWLRSQSGHEAQVIAQAMRDYRAVMVKILKEKDEAKREELSAEASNVMEKFAGQYRYFHPQPEGESE